jgi:hypothetical protein
LALIIVYPIIKLYAVKFKGLWHPGTIGPINITPNPLISQSVKTILPNNVQSNGTSVVVVVVDEVELVVVVVVVLELTHQL